MRGLVIEDDSKTAGYLSKGLQEHGFVVDVASDGREGLHLAMTGNYAFVVLDVMLPGIDGWTVLSDLRSSGCLMPVLFLTASDSVLDRVRGLDLGADDFLVKPFAFSELLARIRTILRRGTSRQSEVLTIADHELELIRRRVQRSDRKLELSPKEFGLLSLLMRRNGEVLSRTLIAEQVWDMNFDSDTNVVDVHIRRLRAKVDEPFAQSLIHTVRGAGYVLEDRR